MGKRAGEYAEEWGDVNIKGRRTSNSGATFCDGDRLVDGGPWGIGRVYEMKSSSKGNGIRISRRDVQVLVQRAIKLSRLPVFIFFDRDTPYAIVTEGHFRIVMRTPLDQSSNLYRQLLSSYTAEGILEGITGGGEGISVKGEHLEQFSTTPYSLLIYYSKSKKPWVIMEALDWLRLVGDIKEKN